MNRDQDYDNDGNNIVPCPICLDVYCPSKGDGKCPEEEEFSRDMKTKSTEEWVEEFKKFAFDRLDFVEVVLNNPRASDEMKSFVVELGKALSERDENQQEFLKNALTQHTNDKLREVLEKVPQKMAYKMGQSFCPLCKNDEESYQAKRWGYGKAIDEITTLLQAEIDKNHE